MPGTSVRVSITRSGLASWRASGYSATMASHSSASLGCISTAAEPHRDKEVLALLRHDLPARRDRRLRAVSLLKHKLVLVVQPGQRAQLRPLVLALLKRVGVALDRHDDSRCGGAHLLPPRPPGLLPNQHDLISNCNIAGGCS